ncbi:hypothetical protein [Methylobacterium haplocladii]|uniref:Uncharacterized protein n=1 Tax=Methylobacterium haplocladii TaxID=1176176 RepID=A0A512IS79_9HYPH|nr:hypothetical protein [Methylobacterium haplocladii]GEP00560.1 hypothetical protein MHA02_29470 [Methylobacterium haplocladii]GJD85475.1 hypothetical protein HPGCJGGD_3364 [Methylobacterium haplocladii]
MTALADVRTLIARLDGTMQPMPARAELVRLLRAVEVDLQPALRRRPRAGSPELAPALRVMARLQHIGSPSALGIKLLPGTPPVAVERHGRLRLGQLIALGHARKDPDGWRITPAGAEAARRLNDECEAASCAG